MKGIIKKIVSVVLTLAIVITSMSYTPKNVQAVDYTGLTDVGNLNLAPESLRSLKVGKGENVNSIAEIFFQNANTIYFHTVVISNVGNATAGNNGNVTSITINGKEVLGTTVTGEGAGFWIHNPEDVLIEEENVMVITCGSNSGTIVLTNKEVEKPPFEEGKELVPEDKQNTTVTGNAMEGGNPWDNEYKMENISYGNNIYYVATVTVEAEQARKIQLRFQSNANANIEDKGENFYTFDVAAGQKVKVTYVLQSKMETAGYFDICYGYIDEAVKAGQIKFTDVSLKQYSEQPSETTKVEVISGEEPSTGLKAPSSVFLYNFTDASDGYKAVITDKNEYPEGVTPSYQIFVNNAATPVATVENEGVISADVISALGLASDAQYNVTAKAVATIEGETVESSQSGASTFYYTTGTASQNTDIDEIYINTSRTSSDSSLNIYTDKTKAKINSAITVKKADGSVEEYDYGTTNVRGNSTSTAAKKAYNIKFNKAHDLFEMGSAKKWCLLANAFDRSLIRNQFAIDFQRNLEKGQTNGNVFTSNCRPIELYIDGKYLGSYTLVEAVETGTDRVNINDAYTYGKKATEGVDRDDVMNESAKTPVTIGGTTYDLYDMLLELANDTKETEARMETEAYYFDTTYERFALNSPERSEGDTSYGYKPGENRPVYVTNVETYLKAFEVALDANDFDAISQFIDVDSFVDFYITTELFMVKDINFSSTRFYIKGGKMYAGPLWDADLSAGNILGDEGQGYDKIFAQDFVWFKKLMSNETFEQKVKSKYTELQPTITALYADNGTIDNFVKTISKSAVANFEKAYNAKTNTTNGWGYDFVDQSEYGRYGSATTFSNHQGYVDEYKTWLKNRNDWLLTTWAIDDEGGNETETEASVQEPITPIGLGVSSTANNQITVVWGQNDNMINLGQKYNVYVDDEKVLSEVGCGSYPINNIPAGVHTVYVTAVLGTKETAKSACSATVTVLDGSGSVETSPAETEIYENQPTVDISAITDWVKFDYRSGATSSVYDTEYYISDEVLKTISTRELTIQSGLFDGVSAKPAYNYKDKIMDGQPVLSWVTGTGVTGVVINGMKYPIKSNTTVQLESDCLFINQSVFELPAGEYSKVFTITLLGKSTGHDEDYTFAIKVVRAPKNLSVNDYSSYTGKYICKFDALTEAENYKVYVDGAETSISVGGSGDFFTVDELKEAGIASGKHVVAITGVDAQGNESEISNTYEVNVPETAGNNNDIAQIYIQTDDTKYTPTAKDGKTLIEKPAGKLPSAITVFDQNGTYDTIYEDVAKTTVKVRGNSTANAEKKAYNISFDTKKDLFGLGVPNHKGAKKWSLLANAFDKSLIRNKIGMDFGYSIGLTFNSQSRFVDLYFNGVYLGNYLLIESVETGKDRVNIDSENGVTYNTDALLELDMKGAEPGVLNFRTDIYDQLFIFGSPEEAKDIDEKDAEGNPILTESGNKFSEQKVIDTKDLLNRFETDLSKGDYEEYSQYVDIESFVQFYLVNELFQTKDIAYSSTRFYISGGKLYAGPMWDLDLSSGNVEGQGPTQWIATEMPWFRELMKDSNFKSKVIAKYKELHPQIVGLYTDGGTIDQTVNEILASATRNYEPISEGGAGWAIKGRQSGDGWSNSDKWDTYDATVAAFKEHMRARVEFLDQEWEVSYNATISTEGDVIVSWDEVENATAYKVSFRAKETGNQIMSDNTGIEEELYNLLPMAVFAAPVAQADEEYHDCVQYITGATEFNFTQAGYELEPDSTVKVEYTLDNVTTDDEVAAATYSLLDTVKYLVGDDVEWVLAGEHDGYTYYYNKDHTAQEVVNVQKPAWESAKELGVYMNFAGAIAATSDIKINSNVATDSQCAREGSGASIYCSALTEGVNTIEITHAEGTSEVLIKKVKGTATEPADPNPTGLTLTQRWEHSRDCEVSWKAVEGASAYAVYADGKLVDTTTDLSMDLNAYSFANETNANGDATTVGAHTIFVKALKENEEPVKTLNAEDADYKTDFTLFVNYIYGTLTDIWNVTGIDSAWNFTVCESANASDIARGADVDVHYNTDATATVTLKDVGQHEKAADQAWTIKSAIYNQKIPGYQQILDTDSEEVKAEKKENNTVKLFFTITGPACLVGQEIQIKCIHEEVTNGNYTDMSAFAEYGYKEAKYQFEEGTVNGEKVAVLEYSIEFTSIKEDYDLLFGLGLLDPNTLNNGEPIKLEFSDTEIDNDSIYAVEAVTAESNEPSKVNIVWTTDMPEDISEAEKARYSYNLYVDGKLTEENKGLKELSKSLEGLKAGEHTFVVESIYDNSTAADGTSTITTGRASTKITVEGAGPDLIITDVIAPEPQSADGKFRVGDTVTIKYKMVNIGNMTAIPNPEADALNTNSYVSKNGAEFVYEAWNRNESTPIEPGMENAYEGEYTYTFQESGEYVYRIKADAGEKVEELNEDNNTYDVKFTVYDKVQLQTLDLYNDGNDVIASWPKTLNDDNSDYIIEYTTSDGSKHSIKVPYDSNTETYECKFPKGQYPADHSTVYLAVDIPDGENQYLASAVAQSDMVITNIYIPKRIYAKDEIIQVTASMKNIGTADAYSKDNILQKICVNGILFNWSDINIHHWEVFREERQTIKYTIAEHPEQIREDGTMEICTFADGDYKLDELDENNNYSEKITIAVMEQAAKLVLANADIDGDGFGEGVVTAIWPGDDHITGFEIIYRTGEIFKLGNELSTSVTRTLFVDLSQYTEDLNGNRVYQVGKGTLIYTPLTGLYTYTFDELLDNQSIVEVRATTEQNPYSDKDFGEYVSDTAIADLRIVNVSDSVGGEVKTKVPFAMDITTINDGTACIPAAPNDFDKYYGGWVITSLQSQNDVEEKAGNEHGAVSFTGMAPGQREVVTLQDALITGHGTYDLVLKVDDPGHTYSDPTGYIRESNEENNTFVYRVQCEFEQKKMDWKPMNYSNAGQAAEAGVPITETYPFAVGGGGYKSKIEFKILDTNILDMDYEDIAIIAGGYNGDHMSFKLTGEYLLFDTNNTNMTSHAILEYSQANRAYCNYYEENKNNESLKPDYTKFSSGGYDIVDQDGNVIVSKNTTTPAIDYVDNGWNFQVISWGLGKYYTFKVTNTETGKYVEVAFRVVGETGDWIQAYGSGDSDSTHVPVYYHDNTYEAKGTIFYDAEDKNLSSCVVYNGNHMAIHIDSNSGANLTDVSTWKLGISYASVDDKGEFVIPDPSDPDYKEILWTPENGGIVGYNSANTALMMFPHIIKDLPVHSDRVDEYGNPIEVDAQYYYMKLYYDLNDMDKYISIPIKFVANIPEIEEIHGLAVAARESTLSVSWYNTDEQNVHSYRYDVYIDGEKVLTSVEAGSYNFKGYDLQTIGTTHTIRVVGRWGDHCQRVEQVYKYKVQGTDNKGPAITDEEFDYNKLNQDQWVPLNGEQILPIRLEGTVSQTVNAEIYYYTDTVAQFDAIGYNGYYISLNGDEEYFSGPTSKLYVRDGDSYRYEAKTIYDSFNKSKILMNASELFTTYGGVSGDDMYKETFYYTVRVYGDNGAAYRDFYFKVVPAKQDAGVVKNTGEWRHISNDYTLPVQFEDLTLEGEISFFDYPSQTNTYDVSGYNGSYISFIGAGTSYVGGDTTMQVSKPISKEMAKDFDHKIDTNTFKTKEYIEMAQNEKLHTVYDDGVYASDEDIYTTKDIYDSVYDGYMNINATDTFTVEYGTNYYIVKLTTGDGNVTFVPMKIVVNSGDVEVQGFQINYDKGLGSASEINPTCRVVSRASKVMSIHDKLYRVKKHGTVYGVTSQINDSDMTIDSSSSYVSHMETKNGLYENYVSGRGDDEYYDYYAFTIRWVSYNFEALKTAYSYRAYAIIEDGTDDGKVVYGQNIYSTTIYDVAKHLYDNCQIYTKSGHEFMYRDIVNLVTMDTNRSKISNAMAKALGVTSTNSDDYKLINAVYKDILYYTRCTNGYDYANRGDFTPALSTNHSDEVKAILEKSGETLTDSDENDITGAVLEKVLLQKLNAKKLNPETEDYTTLSDWIYKETSNYKNSSGVVYEGFYRKVEFDWNSNLFQNFDSE